MKFLIAILALVATASTAQADGFRCVTAEGDLNIRVYNHTDAGQGTRNAAIMVLSDPFVQYGNKTIATFRASNSLLGQEGTRYTANVDLRFNDSARKGENVGGTKLGYLKHIFVDVEFSYAAPVPAGSWVKGTVTYLKRDGSDSFQAIRCQRYLKGE